MSFYKKGKNKHKKQSNKNYQDMLNERDENEISGSSVDVDNLQAQEQRQRSVEASKQRLYDVLTSTIDRLAELDEYDNKKEYCGFSEETENDVLARVVAGLACFRTHFNRSAPRDVVEGEKRKILDYFLKCVAGRVDFTLSRVDHYCKNVVQVLIGMSMTLYEPESWRKTKSLDQETVSEVLGAFAEAKHKGELQDKKFHEDASKKATLILPRLKNGNIYLGARRMVKVDEQDTAFKLRLENILGEELGDPR